MKAGTLWAMGLLVGAVAVATVLATHRPPASPDAAGDLPFYSYAVTGGERLDAGGWMNWTLTGEERLVRRNDLTPVLATEVQADFDLPGLQGSVLTYVGPDGEDVMSLEHCRREKGALACRPRVGVEWGERAAVSLHGSLLVNSLVFEGGGASIPGFGASFAVEKEGPHVRLLPVGEGTRRAALCNLLDDETLVDLERGLVIECRTPDGSFTLASDAPPPAWKARDETSPPRSSPFGDPVSWRGRLPPGSETRLHPWDMSPEEAFSAARNGSAAFRAFLAAHPDAVVVTAASSAMDHSATLEAMEGRRSEFMLTLRAPSGEQYGVTLARVTQSVGNLALPPEDMIESEGPEEKAAPYPLEKLRPGKVVPLDRLFQRFKERHPMPLDGFTLDLLPPSEDRAEGEYEVGFSWPGRGCEDGFCISSMIHVSASKGRLLGALLDPEDVARFAYATLAP